MSISPYAPLSLLDGSWHTLRYLTSVYNRSLRTISRWCQDGTLISVGCRVYKDSSNRWWVKMPDE